MKKKAIIIIIIMITIMITLISAVFLIVNKRNMITFYINGKEAENYSQKVEYSDSIDYSTNAIKLTAKKNNKDITKQIKYNKVKITKLKTYQITYEVEGKKFVYEMEVVDTSAPKITGEATYSIKQNETFDQTHLNLIATDNFDKDITDKITTEDSVDTSTPGEYTLTFKVSDSSNNIAEFKCIVTVEAKEEIIDSSKETNNAKVDNNYNTQSNINIVSNPNDITVMINKYNYLPDGWAPNDLVSIGGNHYLRAEAANSLNQMRQAAINSGISFNVVSSYRSQSYQTNLYNNYFAVDPINAPFYSAYPRTSEHELGLAIDISYDYSLHSDLQNSALGQWMMQHAHEYGWIMRYPYGKTDITGYVFEAWHYRYVGTSLATQLRNSGLTMEELY